MRTLKIKLYIVTVILDFGVEAGNLNISLSVSSGTKHKKFEN
jgi:hypothetical protein